MRRAAFIQKIAACFLTAAFLNSCGIRLPDAPLPGRHSGGMKTYVSKPGQDPDLLVWLIADDLHTGMVFDYDWLLESGFIPPVGFGHPKYVTLSWGDKTAYVEKGLHTPWKFCRALFTPTPSVMELIPANWNIPEVCPHQRIWRKLVPRDRGVDIAAFLNDCSRMGADGKPQIVGTSSWGGGVLLESRHIYFFPRMCNTWTTQAIEAIGGDINPWRAITANGVIRQAEISPNDFEQIWWGNGAKP